MVSPLGVTNNAGCQQTTDFCDSPGDQLQICNRRIKSIGPTREHAKWQGLKSMPWDRATIAAADAVVIATNHKAVNLAELGEWAALVVDTRDAMKGVAAKAAVVKA